MAEYIELPLTADATALSDLGKEYMADQIAGWVARPGNVESILLEANGQMGAEVVDQAAQIPPLVFAYFGQTILGIPVHEAVPATGSATFAFDPDYVGSVPAGTMVAFENPDGNSYVFGTDDDVESAGTLTVGVTALEPGEEPNGSTGDGEVIDAVDGIASVTMSGASGGVAEETEDEYLDRLADALTILAPRPILPQDFATMARQVPGVGRAVAMDMYQPGTNDNRPPLVVEGAPVLAGAGANNVARCVSVVITADDGTAPTQTLMHTTWALLDGNREVTFLAYVVPPSYTSIDVQATVVPYRGYLSAEVKQAAEDMLRTWLDPSSFGSENVGEEPSWTSDNKVRIYEAVDYLNRAGGVYYVESVQIRKHGDAAWSDVDIALTGIAPLPLAGDLTVTVHVV